MRVDSFNVIIDALVVELNRRKQAYVEVSEKMYSFSGTTRYGYQCNRAAFWRTGITVYSGDLSQTSVFSCDTTLLSPTVNNLYQLYHFMHIIVSKQLTSACPNVDTALRMFICLPIANCSGERFFSALK